MIGISFFVAKRAEFRGSLTLESNGLRGAVPVHSGEFVENRAFKNNESNDFGCLFAQTPSLLRREEMPLGAGALAVVRISECLEENSYGVKGSCPCAGRLGGPPRERYMSAPMKLSTVSTNGGF